MASRAYVEQQVTAIPVQQDPDVLAAATRLAGEDMCSINDLSSAEVRAILKLGHDVKRNPRDYRHALDAKKMVLMFEKASLRTRLSFEAGINTMGGNAIFFDQTNSPLGERESIADIARNVGYGFAFTKRRAGVIDEDGAASHGVDAGLEAETRAQAGLLKHEHHLLGVEGMTILARVALHIMPQLQNRARLRA